MRARGKNFRVWASVIRCCTIVIVRPHMGLSFLVAKGKREIHTHTYTYIFFFFYPSLSLFIHLLLHLTNVYQTLFLCIPAPRENQGEPKELFLLGLLLGPEKQMSDLVLMVEYTYTSRVLCLPSPAVKMREG